MIPRTFAAYQALAAGAKTPRELKVVLGCSVEQARRAAQGLCETGQARRRSRVGVLGYVYEVMR
jgi:hypothetical protein